MADKIHVTHFQRRPRPGFNFSLEFIFEDVRNRLKDRVQFSIKISRLYNDGFLSKIYNILEACFRQNDCINHITGEVHFLNLLMNRNNVILTILDCGFLYRKSGLSQQLIKFLYLRGPIKKAKFITAISEFTKKEIIKHTGCNPDKIHVIPVAINSIFQPHPKSFNSIKPTILQIGVGPNKNVPRLIEALEGIPCRLFIVGLLSIDLRMKLEKHGIEFENCCNLTETEVLAAYKACDIVSFVSTFEGFGMPIVEANAIERVCITSNVSSMPEVAGDAAYLVDPFSIQEIRDGILRLIHDASYRELLLKNGRRNRNRFDGDKIADTYYELYQQISSTLS